MKKAITTLVLTIIMFSCSSDDKPVVVNQTKVISKISTQYVGSNATPENYTTEYEYTVNNEISKISHFRNGVFEASYEYTYQNGIPVSAQYISIGDADQYPINYGYDNDILSTVSYPTYNTIDLFDYDETLSEYSNFSGDLRFRVNQQSDIFYKIFANTTLNYNFDVTKKGPLFNVVNKKWMPTMWFIGRQDSQLSNVLTSFPVTSVTSSDNSTTYNYVNSYGVDGFVTKSMYSNLTGSSTIEINFTYKNL